MGLTQWCSVRWDCQVPRTGSKGKIPLPEQLKRKNGEKTDHPLNQLVQYELQDFAGRIITLLSREKLGKDPVEFLR